MGLVRAWRWSVPCRVSDPRGGTIGVLHVLDQHLIAQMDDSERRTYLAESLFLNTVKYENDKLEAYMKKLSKK